nr:MAG TPA: hypothetical protein [Caudoviricetes sp.]
MGIYLMTKIMDFYPLKFLKSFGDFPRLNN